MCVGQCEDCGGPHDKSLPGLLQQVLSCLLGTAAGQPAQGKASCQNWALGAGCFYISAEQMTMLEAESGWVQSVSGCQGMQAECWGHCLPQPACSACNWSMCGVEAHHADGGYAATDVQAAPPSWCKRSYNTRMPSAGQDTCAAAHAGMRTTDEDLSGELSRLGRLAT